MHINDKVADVYWTINRAHHGANKALALLASHAPWKDCQQAAEAAEDKAKDVLIMAQEARIHSIVPTVRPMIRATTKAARAPTPEKMHHALLEAVRMAVEMENMFHKGKIPQHKKHTQTRRKQTRRTQTRRKQTRRKQKGQKE